MESLFLGTDPILLGLLCAASLLAGFIDSIAGGGGLILLPAFMLAGIPPQAALGTNKFAAMFGTATALANFVKSGKVIWKLALFGLAFSLLGSMTGTRAILYVPPEATARIILTLLPVTAVVTFLPRKQFKTSLLEFSRREVFLLVPLLCVGIGFYDGFFGPGTGTFLIFGFYVFMGLHLVQASALAKVFNLTSNVGSFCVFAFAGQVLYTIGLPVALANILGGYLGSSLAIQKGQQFIKAVLLVVFAILFISLAFRVWQGR